MGEVTEEANSFINLVKPLSIVIEFYLNTQPNMFLIGGLGDWNVIKIHARMMFICTPP